MRACFTAIAVLGAISTTPAMATPTGFDIPVLPASQAIKLFAEQADLQIIARAGDLNGLETKAIHGDFEPARALEMLITGTGLEAVRTGPNAFILRLHAPAELPKPKAATTAPQQTLPPASEQEARADLIPPFDFGDSEEKKPHIDEIVVTGSRIDRGESGSVRPSVSYDRGYIERRGVTNIANILEETPGFGISDANGIGGQSTFGVGQTFVDFLGLGSQRTLTLVNGRRFVSSHSVTNVSPAEAGQQVDLNMIPVGLIERVETIAVGGAPIYGSDAIAGTINIILKDRVDGLHLQAQYGMADKGDASNYAVQAQYGNSFADRRGSFILSAEHNNQNGLLESDRDFMARRHFLTANPADTGMGDGIPAFRLVDDQVFAGVTDGGVPLPPGGLSAGWVTAGYPDGFFVFDADGNPVQFAPDGSLVPYELGRGGGDKPIFVSGGDGLRIPDYVNLITPVRRTLLNVMMDYAVSDRLSLFLESSYVHTSSTEIRELLAINAAPIPQGGAITMNVDNPFLSDGARATLLANGLQDFSLARNMSDILDAKPGTTKIDLFRTVAGLEGTWQLAGHNWRWDASFNYGRSSNRSEISNLNDTRFYAAVDAVRDPATGQIACADASMAGCMPLNLFGEGQASAAAIAYVVETGVARSLNEQKILSANIGGSLPWGIAAPIEIGLGYEHREEWAHFAPDSLLATGNSRLPGFLEVDGRYNTDEFYGEFLAPLVVSADNNTILRDWAVEGSFRSIGNSVAGHDVAWTLGTQVEPMVGGALEGLSFRGTLSRAIRAPAIPELFLGAAPIRASAGDPCSATSFRAGPVPTVREANCRAALAAAGISNPADFQSDIEDIGITGVQVGNPSLRNEKARSWSVGLVYQPETLPALRLSADWIDITLTDGIQALSVGQLLQACYDSPAYPSAPACSAFTRGTGAEAGQITDYRSGYYNTARMTFDGLMTSVAYSTRLDHRLLGLDLAGMLHFDSKVFYTRRLDVMPFENSAPEKLAGLIGQPHFQAFFSLRYSSNNVELAWQTRWTGAAKLDNSTELETLPVNRVADYMIHNISYGLRVNEHLRLRLNVDNLFDRKPPANALIGSSNALRRSYDVLGRRAFLTVSTAF
ncbi:TonB-dependent receptor [Kordiimonas aestuarii]|uniref:TonB-dependent receptor n=1 Tax=Kordiimonas aestuarii TaxID=1005925 RepID=UPI0021D2A12A|nr:TonB-dependent receptor [Kordiimonas aestuarii]